MATSLYLAKWNFWAPTCLCYLQIMHVFCNLRDSQLIWVDILCFKIQSKGWSYLFLQARPKLRKIKFDVHLRDNQVNKFKLDSNYVQIIRASNSAYVGVFVSNAYVIRREKISCQFANKYEHGIQTSWCDRSGQTFRFQWKGNDNNQDEFSTVHIWVCL